MKALLPNELPGARTPDTRARDAAPGRTARALVLSHRFACEPNAVRKRSTERFHRPDRRARGLGNMPSCQFPPGDLVDHLRVVGPITEIGTSWVGRPWPLTVVFRLMGRPGRRARCFRRRSACTNEKKRVSASTRSRVRTALRARAESPNSEAVVDSLEAGPRSKTEPVTDLVPGDQPGDARLRPCGSRSGRPSANSGFAAGRLASSRFSIACMGVLVGHRG